jgi:hypothetical protein
VPRAEVDGALGRGLADDPGDPAPDHHVTELGEVLPRELFGLGRVHRLGHGDADPRGGPLDAPRRRGRLPPLLAVSRASR